MPDAGASAYSSYSSTNGRSRGPANDISIRTVEEERYQIVDEASGRVIEEVEASKAFWEVYRGAIYLNQARTFLCKSLDTTRRRGRPFAMRITHAHVHPYSFPLRRRGATESKVVTVSVFVFVFVFVCFCFFYTGKRRNRRVESGGGGLHVA